MSRSKRRLDSVGQKVASMPVSRAALQSAVARFCDDGELPEHDRLAKKTVEWMIRQPKHRPIRELLLEESVSDFEPVRDAARFVIRMLVSSGCDLKSRNFVDEDMEMPKFGSVGLHCLGFPEAIVREPYEEQADRLLVRMQKVRSRVPASRQSWLKDFAGEAAEFFRSGTLPEDDFVREAVLVYGEFFALARNLGGEADPEVLAAFEDVAKAESGHQRDAATQRLQVLAADGRIP